MRVNLLLYVRKRQTIALFANKFLNKQIVQGSYSRQCIAVNLFFRFYFVYQKRFVYLQHLNNTSWQKSNIGLRKTKRGK